MCQLFSTNRNDNQKCDLKWRKFPDQIRLFLQFFFLSLKKWGKKARDESLRQKNDKVLHAHNSTKVSVNHRIGRQMSESWKEKKWIFARFAFCQFSQPCWLKRIYCIQRHISADWRNVELPQMRVHAARVNWLRLVFVPKMNWAKYDRFTIIGSIQIECGWYSFESVITAFSR